MQNKIYIQAHIDLGASKLRKSHFLLISTWFKQTFKRTFRHDNKWETNSTAGRCLMLCRKCFDMQDSAEWGMSFWRAGSIWKILSCKRGVIESSPQSCSANRMQGQLGLKGGAGGGACRGRKSQDWANRAIEISWFSVIDSEHLAENLEKILTLLRQNGECPGMNNNDWFNLQEIM